VLSLFHSRPGRSHLLSLTLRMTPVACYHLMTQQACSWHPTSPVLPGEECEPLCFFRAVQMSLRTCLVYMLFTDAGLLAPLKALTLPFGSSCCPEAKPPNGISSTKNDTTSPPPPRHSTMQDLKLEGRRPSYCSFLRELVVVLCCLPACVIPVHHTSMLRSSRFYQLNRCSTSLTSDFYFVGKLHLHTPHPPFYTHTPYLANTCG
jgi:hypothetical protein